MNQKARDQRCYPSMVVCALTAIFLTACGGGSSAGEPAGNAAPTSQVDGNATLVAAGPGTTPAPGPRQPPVAREAGSPISANTTAQRNTRYDVSGTGSTTIDVTLPPFIAPGDFVSVRGVSGRPWRIVPNCCPGTTARSDMTSQAVITTNLPGNVTPGQRWTPRMAPMQWHAAASSQDGQVLVAANNPGNLYVSTDAGVNWTVGNSPTGQWTSVVVKTTPYPFPAASAVSMVAVATGGGMYRSIDRGVTWTQLASTDGGVSLSGRQWQSVTSDQTGNVVAAAVLNGPIYRIGSPGFATSFTTGWQAGTLEGSSTVLERPWRALASSVDAGVMVAASDNGEVYVSITAGRTWALRNVIVGGATVASAWHRVAMSDDGNSIAIAGRANAALYVSRDRGLSWVQTAAPAGDYTALAMSADGQVIGGTLTNGVGNPTIGSVQVSRDGGTSFAAVSPPGQDRNWRALAMTADGHQFVVAAGTSGSAAGQLYTSLGNRTSIGAAGSIGGGANDFVELEYLGNARFKVRAFDGGPFTIR